MVLYQDLFKALGENKVEYLVAGGFAVNFHNVQRATADLDLIVHLEEKNIKKFIKLITQIGYLPRLPVSALDFADSKIRKKWIEEKNMLVFSFYNPKLKFETIDIFVEEPKPFLQLVSRRLDVKAFGIIIPVVGVEDLIEMKVKAGREKDLFDVAQLRKRQQSDGS
jgi:hypothetical protein